MTIDYRKILELLNAKISYRTYRMWHSVPHIGKTALAVDETVRGGGQRIITRPKDFPPEVTENYILSAVQNGAYSLGGYDCSKRSPVFIPWYDRVGQYPPGYFTHQIGY